jgi:hypothetical protein
MPAEPALPALEQRRLESCGPANRRGLRARRTTPHVDTERIHVIEHQGRRQRPSHSPNGDRQHDITALAQPADLSPPPPRHHPANLDGLPAQQRPEAAGSTRERRSMRDSDIRQRGDVLRTNVAVDPSACRQDLHRVLRRERTNELERAYLVALTARGRHSRRDDEDLHPCERGTRTRMAAATIVIVSVPATGHSPSAAPRWSPAIRLLVDFDRARKVAWRPAAVGGALVARGLRIRAYPIWPTRLHPRIVADLSHPPAAVWLRRTFEQDAPRRRLVGPATWSAVRARGLVVGAPSRLVRDAVKCAQDRDMAGLRLALYSVAGVGYSKAACFVFEEGAEEPAMVVKAMPDARFADRLSHETKVVETFRRMLGPGSAAAEALPLRPLFAGTAAEDFVVVESLDPMAVGTGFLSEPDAAITWLRDFHEGTTTTIRPWDEADTEAAIDPVRYAWQRARPASADAVISRVGRLLGALEGEPVRRCGVHGDFWRDNLAQLNGRLRVYDWEWAQPEGTPFFDLWMIELGLLRRQVEEGNPRFVEMTREALARVRAEHARRGLDPRFALAMLAPSLGQLTFRIRRETGAPGGAEAESVHLMAATELLLE